MLVSKLSLSVLLCGLASAATFSFAAEAPSFEKTVQAAAKPSLDKEPAGFFRMKIGAIDVVALSDGSLPFALEGLTVNDKPGELEKLLAFRYEKSPIIGSFNCYLLHIGDRWVLIDSGSANLFGPSTGKLPDALTNAGVKPEEITDIFITHLHPDHIGGVTLNGKKVFPNATLHFNEREITLSKEAEAKAPEPFKPFFKQAQDAVKPYADSGKLETFKDAVELLPGLKSQPAYGHTPGHTFYVFEDGGQKIVFVGDMIHIPSAQFDDPDIAMKFDFDSAKAIEVRKNLLADAAKNGYEVAGAHLPFPGCGHVSKEGDHYRFVPVPYVNDAIAK